MAMDDRGVSLGPWGEIEGKQPFCLHRLQQPVPKGPTAIGGGKKNT